MHPPDPLVDVPVPAIPSVTGQAVVDGIQPLLGGGIHAALVDAGQKGFNRLVLEGAGVAQHHWHLPAPGDQYSLYLGFGGFVGLFVLPPAEAPHEAIVLVHAVGAADHKMISSFQRVDLAVHGEQNMGILRLGIHLTAAPILQPVAGHMGRSTLVIAVNAQDRGAAGVQLLLDIYKITLP